MRTIVLSDCHGHPQLVTAALEDAGFVNGRDRLVFAGDFLDRGPLPAACLEVLEEAGAEMLLGNHDAAILLGQQIWPQDGVSWTFRGRLLEGFAAAGLRLPLQIGELSEDAGQRALRGEALPLRGFTYG